MADEVIGRDRIIQRQSLITSQLLPVIVTLAGSTFFGICTLMSFPLTLMNCAVVPELKVIRWPFPVAIRLRTVPLVISTTLSFPITAKSNSPVRVIVTDWTLPKTDSVGTVEFVPVGEAGIHPQTETERTKPRIMKRPKMSPINIVWDIQLSTELAVKRFWRHHTRLPRAQQHTRP